MTKFKRVIALAAAALMLSAVAFSSSAYSNNSGAVRVRPAHCRQTKNGVCIRAENGICPVSGTAICDGSCRRGGGWNNNANCDGTGRGNGRHARRC